MNNRILPLLALLLGLTAAGCADDRMSLEAYAICAMPDTCSFSGKCEAYALGAVSYNSNVDPAGDGFAWLAVAVELRNQLPNNKDFPTGRVNTNDAHVTGVRLEIDGPSSGTISLDVGHQAVPANGTAVIWTYVMPPISIAVLPTGTYNVNVHYVGVYDNGREFDTAGFPVAVELDASGTALPYGCSGTDVIVCGSDQQNLSVCGTP